MKFAPAATAALALASTSTTAAAVAADPPAQQLTEECATTGGEGGGVSSAADEGRDADRVEESSCSLYLAPSSIPGAGLGIYTARDVPARSAVGDFADMFVGIADDKKTVPFRGQQRFLSWLSYVWPSEIDAFWRSSRSTFPVLHIGAFRTDEGLGAADGLHFVDKKDWGRVSAFAPGIASLANSHPDFANVRKNSRKERKEGEVHTGVSFSATRDIPAGSELFLYYGDTWHERHEAKQEWLHQQKREAEDRDGGRDESVTARMLELRDTVRRQHQVHEEGLEEAVGKQDSDDDEDEDESGDSEDDEDSDDFDPVEDLDWLEDNGACLDNLRPGPSTAAPAGLGAFAARSLRQGSLVAPVPFLALKRDDLVIYEADESASTYRNALKFDSVIGKEVLLNYCYGHPDSELLLLPYSPVVSFVKHSKEPNAELKWVNDDALELHPLDVMDMSGKGIDAGLVALRDIAPGEEILVDFGEEWEEAWRQHVASRDAETESASEGFRHERGVPAGFFPEAWKHKSVVYELSPESAKPLQPGEMVQMKWAHNGKPVHSNAYRLGLPPGFSAKMLEFSKDRGIVDKYRQVLYEGALDNGSWETFDAANKSANERWFAQRYMNTAWNFDMHYIAAWDERARVGLLRAMGDAGFNTVLDTVGRHFDLDFLTCFHSSYMGMTEADDSFMHTDIYRTNNKGFNIIFPVMVVNGSKPELDIQSEDVNVILSVNYEYDTVIVMGDDVYHKTSPIDLASSKQMRIVVGTYCAQIDTSNIGVIREIYVGEDPAPFYGQFEMPIKEIHWSNDHSLPK